jgi:hypothetical protein
MAPLRTSALAVDDPQHIFDDIQGQFLLKPESLTVLTKAFLDEVNEGLSGYNHPMAMMCVCFFVGSRVSLFLILLKPDFCQGRSRWHGNWVTTARIHFLCSKF